MPQQGPEEPGAAGRLGVNIAGYFRSENGIGEGARLLIAAIDEAGIPHSTITYARSASRQEHEFAERVGLPEHQVNIVCVNAEDLPQFAGDIGPGLFRDRYTIGTWAWETEEFPDRLKGAFDFVDEVWMPSAYSTRAAAAATDKPVLTFPHPVVAPRVASAATRAELGLPGGFLFLFTFDFFSTARRKNPVGVVEAFKRAFPEPGSGATLALKGANGDRRPADLEALLRSTQGRPDIAVIDAYVPAERNNAIIASCDCYVSLHRGEGFGLTIATAMALGKPAIATGYSGNLEFMTEENSYLVRWARSEVGPECPIYPAGAHWAEPDLDHAAQLMRQVYDNQAEARARGERGRRDIEAKHSPAARAAFLRERLAAVAPAAGTARHRWGERWEFAPPDLRAAVLIAHGPDPMLPTRAGGVYGGVARGVRRAMARLLLHHQVHEQDVERSLLEEVRRLQARVARLEAGSDQALTERSD